MGRSSIWIFCLPGMMTALAVGKETLSQNERELTARLVDDYNKKRYWVV